MSNQHVLKIHPAPLADLLSGTKTAEVRRNDRGFQVGDTVRLMEVNPETGNWTGADDHVRTISHIQTGYGLPDGLCVLSYAQAEQQGAQGAQAGEFQREDRYIVIKRKDLDKLPMEMRLPLSMALNELAPRLPKREYLVIESDWPEYEPTWAAIQARLTGQGAQAGDDQDQVHQLAFEIGEPDENGDGYHFSAEQLDEFVSKLNAVRGAEHE